MRVYGKKALIVFLILLAHYPPSYAEEVIISVAEEGVYRIGPDDLTDIGLDLAAVDPRKIQIKNWGDETPIFISGEEDGSFDVGDYIEFYGVGVTRDSPDYPYTETNIYRLGIGEGDGLRMETINGTPPAAGNAPAEFSTSLHSEENTYFWQNIPDGAGVDHWFWGEKIVQPDSREYRFSLNNISTTPFTPAVRVNLYGKTDDVRLVGADHHTRVYINNCLIEDKHWEGRVASLHSGTIDKGCLIDGVNTVRVTVVGDTGASVDEVFLDWVEVDYSRQFKAESDTFIFSYSMPGPNHFAISNFTGGGEVALFDITSQGDVRRLPSDTDPSGVARFSANTLLPSRFIAVSEGGRKAPLAMKLDTPTTLKSPLHQADYIMITYDGFYGNVLPLAAHHMENGLETMVVNISDVYDEFNYGIRNPGAIKDFLRYAYNNWRRPAPLYVLLVGDGSIDIKDNFKMGNKSYIPTYYIETPSLGRTPSDNWFVSISGGDPLPDMFIGRISASTPAEVDGVVAKIKGYGGSPLSSWGNTLQFVADDDLAEFETLSNDLVANHLSTEYLAKKVYLGNTTADAARAEIINNLEEGVLITNYSGHGSVSSWGNNMLSTAHVANINNQNNLTFMVILNCLNGFFPLSLSPWSTSTQTSSLGEQLLLEPGRGAIASFASTTAGYPSEHSIIAKTLFDSIIRDGMTILGEATTQARISAFSSGVSAESVHTFVLLGDPAVDMKIVQNGLGATTGPGQGEDGATPGTGNSGDSGSGEGEAASEKGGGGCFIGVVDNGEEHEERTVALSLLALLVALYGLSRRYVGSSSR